MMQRWWHAWGLLIALSMAWPVAARADGFENVAIGSRTAAMGGAALANGRDSAMPSINPAGVALVPRTTASLSASLYHLGIVAVPNFHADSDQVPVEAFDDPLRLSQPGIRSQEFSSFPSALAYFALLGEHRLGAALSVPRNISRKFIQNLELEGSGIGQRDQVSTIETEQLYQAALTWAMNLGPRFRLGAGVLVGTTLRTRTTSLSSLQVTGNLGFGRVDRRSTLSAHSVDVSAIVGVQYGDADDGWSYGASVRAPSLHVTGGLTSAVDLALAGSGSDIIATETQEGDFRSGLPLRVGVGVGYRKPRSYGFTLDATIFLPRENEVSREVTVSVSQIGGTAGQGAVTDKLEGLEGIEGRKAVVNLALGGELAVGTSGWARAGVFTDFSALDPAGDRSVFGEQPGLRPYVFPVDRIGMTVGYGTVIGPVDTTFGIRAAFGSGDTGRETVASRFSDSDDLEFDTTEVSTLDVMAFVSAAVDAAAEVEKVKESLPGPAQEVNQ